MKTHRLHAVLGGGVGKIVTDLSIRPASTSFPRPHSHYCRSHATTYSRGGAPPDRSRNHCPRPANTEDTGQPARQICLKSKRRPISVRGNLRPAGNRPTGANPGLGKALRQSYVIAINCVWFYIQREGDGRMSARAAIWCQSRTRAGQVGCPPRYGGSEVDSDHVLASRRLGTGTLVR